MRGLNDGWKEGLSMQRMLRKGLRKCKDSEIGKAKNCKISGAGRG